MVYTYIIHIVCFEPIIRSALNQDVCRHGSTLTMNVLVKLGILLINSGRTYKEKSGKQRNNNHKPFENKLHKAKISGLLVCLEIESN